MECFAVNYPSTTGPNEMSTLHIYRIDDCSALCSVLILAEVNKVDIHAVKPEWVVLLYRGRERMHIRRRRKNRFWPHSKWWCWEGCQREPSLHMLIWQMRTRKPRWALPGALLPTASSQTPAPPQGHLPQVKVGTVVLFEGFVVETFGKVKSREKSLIFKSWICENTGR